LLAVVVIGTIIFLWNYSFSDILVKLDVTSYYSYFQWGLGLFCFSVAALILLTGIKMMFHTRIKIKVVSLLLVTCALIGLGLLIHFGWMYKQGVAYKETVKQPVLSSICPDTLFIRASDRIEDEEAEELEVNTNKGRDAFKIAYTKDLIRVFYNTHLTVKPSKNDSFQLVVLKSARGETENQAAVNAQQINFGSTLNGNILTLDKGLILEPRIPFKFQQVYAKLKVPVGTILIVDKPIMKMINAHYEEDFDMGETLKMTSKGLKCLDCIDTEDEEDDMNIEWNVDDEKGDVNIRIGKKDVESKTDKNGNQTINIEKSDVGPVTITQKTKKDTP
jgi:hypothetical protein